MNKRRSPGEAPSSGDQTFSRRRGTGGDIFRLMGQKHKEEGAFMEDGQILDLYWRRDQQAIRETDGKYGKLLHGIA